MLPSLHRRPDSGRRLGDRLVGSPVRVVWPGAPTAGEERLARPPLPARLTRGSGTPAGTVNPRTCETMFRMLARRRPAPERAARRPAMHRRRTTASGGACSQIPLPRVRALVPLVDTPHYADAPDALDREGQCPPSQWLRKSAITHLDPRAARLSTAAWVWRRGWRRRLSAGWSAGHESVRGVNVDASGRRPRARFLLQSLTPIPSLRLDEADRSSSVRSLTPRGWAL